MDDAAEARDEARVGAAANALEERGLFRSVLCARCSRGTVYRRARHLEPVAYCSVMRREVPTDIAECTDFTDPREMGLYQMQELALKVDTRPGINDGSYR